MLPEDGEGLLVLKSWEQVWAEITRKWEEKVRLSERQLLKPFPAYYLVPRLIEAGLIQRPPSCWPLFKLIHKGLI